MPSGRFTHKHKSMSNRTRQGYHLQFLLYLLLVCTCTYIQIKVKYYLSGLHIQFMTPVGTAGRWGSCPISTLYVIHTDIGGEEWGWCGVLCWNRPKL